MQKQSEHIILQSSSSQNVIASSINTIKPKKKKSIAKHFGKLKRGLDGVSYQQTIRNEWK